MSQKEEYWIERMRRAQEKQATQSIAELQKELNIYYSKAMRRLIKQFEATYEKLLRQTAEGITPSVADLYKLDTYWKLQGALRLELQKLGDKQEVLFSKKFEEAYEHIWKSISFPHNQHSPNQVLRMLTNLSILFGVQMERIGAPVFGATLISSKKA